LLLLRSRKCGRITIKNNTEQEFYFTFDGHGSTRILTDLVGAIAELYAFDAYGNAIGFDPSVALTEFLYSGEQFDSKIGQQYLRARYYDPTTGRFNRLDPFFGNLIDPLSLHKYLYTHADPINGIDPSGKLAILPILMAVGITLNVLSLIHNIRMAQTYYSMGDNTKSNWYAAWAMVDVIFLAIPFMGPGAGGGIKIAVTAGAPALRTVVTASAVTLSAAGVKYSTIYGYLSTTVHTLINGYSYATSNSSGGSSTPTSGQWGNPPHSVTGRSAEYQNQIAKQFGDAPPNPGDEYYLLSRWFDGFNAAKKTLLEAKGPGYEKLLKDLYDERAIEKPWKNLIDQMDAQVNIARQTNNKLQWYIAEESVWQKLLNHAHQKSYQDVLEVIHTPIQ
jgi:RHS repeat-associated protein